VDGWTDMMKLTVALHNFVNVPKNKGSMAPTNKPGKVTMCSTIK
jgi:hypothetical protein